MESFLLRFQEHICRPNIQAAALSETASQKISNQDRSIPGPKTITEIKRESADRHPGALCMNVIPQ